MVSADPGFAFTLLKYTVIIFVRRYTDEIDFVHESIILRVESSSGGYEYHLTLTIVTVL